MLSLVQQINSRSETAEAIRRNEPTDFCDKGNTPSVTATPTVVGPTTAELESINELIRFDHVYYKHESSPVQTSLEKPDQNVQKCDTNSQTKVNIHITQDISSDIPVEDIMKAEPELCAIDESDLSDINFELLNEYRQDYRNNGGVLDALRLNLFDDV